jgi:hypothetical protein
MQHSISGICSLLLLIVACMGLQTTSAKDYTVGPSSDFMCCGSMAYSRTDLLLMGLNVLNKAESLGIPLNTYRTLQKLDICNVMPTHRGKRAGISKKCNSDTKPKTDQPIFCLLNARSISNKWDEIIDFIVDNDVDVISITETWLGKDNQPPYLPDGYSFVHLPRPNRRGGGVGVLYRNNLKVQVNPSFSAASFESLEVLLTLNSTHIRLFVIYRPPPSTVNGLTKALFFEEFDHFLAANAAATGRTMLVGDFNFHWENQQDPETKIMKNMFTSYSLQQHINDPTHKSGHALDWIISRDDDDMICDCSVSSLISDHHAILYKLNLHKPALPRKLITSRSYRTLDNKAFKHDVLESTCLRNLQIH